MPWHHRETVKTFAPKVSRHLIIHHRWFVLKSQKAWAAMKDLLGGEDRIDPESSSWGDSFIVNLGAP